MKQRSWLVSAGIILYVLLSITDRFLCQIPDPVYIAIALIGILCIVVGFIRDSQQKRK